MDAASGTPLTPPYSIPPTATVGAPLNAPNPSGGADAGNTSTATLALHPAAPDAAHKHRCRAGRQQGTANRVVGQEEGLRAKAPVACGGCRPAGAEEGEGARF
jgi:hypothetical protein